MDRQEIFERSLDYFLAPVGHLLRDAEVTEILINGPNNVYVERRGRLARADVAFADEYWLQSLARNVAEYVGRQLDADHHSLSGRLPWGWRVHVVIPPVSRSGVCLSIRKFSHRRLTLDQLVDHDALSAEAAELLQLAVEQKCNIVISGGTGTGKTTLLNALAAAIPANERILILEETSELQLAQPHCVYFETQQAARSGRGEVTIRDLFVDSLRMRPDRIIVGEVRRGEALDMIQSMLSGHCGALTTVHANSPADAVTRLETLCLMSDTSLPHHVARLQVASAVHLVVQIERRQGHRRVQTISECRGLDSCGKVRWRPLLRTRLRDDRPRLEFVGNVPRFLREPYGRQAGLARPHVAQLLGNAEERRRQRDNASPAQRRSRPVADLDQDGN